MSNKTTQKEKVQFMKSDINLNPARLKGEPFDNYKTRRKQGNEAVKNAVKGRLIWVSATLKGKANIRVKGQYCRGMEEDKI